VENTESSSPHASIHNSSAVTYDAFISYSHSRDEAVATSLQYSIQRLGKAWYQRRALRIFRDETSLSATSHLWPSIERALDQSRFFLLLTSPEAAASTWVSMEVEYWLKHKSTGSLLLGLTDGSLVWDRRVGDFVGSDPPSLPKILQGRFAHEPKWVDLRRYRDRTHLSQADVTEAAANFAAAIRGIAKDDLLSQEVRQQRRTLLIAWSAVVVLSVLAATSIWQWTEAVSAKRIVEQTEREVRSERDKAERNLALARRAADDLTLKLAREFRDRPGISVEYVRQILDVARALMDELLRVAPDDIRLLQSRAKMLREFATTYATAGDQVSSRTAAEEGLAIVRRLVALDPGNQTRKQDLSEMLGILGNTLTNAGDESGALAFFQDRLSVMRELVAETPLNLSFQNDLSLSLNQVGDIYRFKESTRKAALDSYEESVAIMRRLSAMKPENIGWRYNFSVGLNKVGDMRRLVPGARAGALPAYEESLAIAREVLSKRPDNTDWQRGIAVRLVGVGDLLQIDLGERAKASAAYNEGVSIIRGLIASDPANAQWHADLVLLLYKASTVSEPTNTRALLQEALAIAQKLTDDRKRTLRLPGWIPMLQKELAKLPN
jgi:tetratricopeptide (TPR) repeat protein